VCSGISLRANQFLFESNFKAFYIQL